MSVVINFFTYKMYMDVNLRFTCMQNSSTKLWKQTWQGLSFEREIQICNKVDPPLGGAISVGGLKWEN